MRSVLHLLPHAGGGGEKYIDLLETMPDFRHERTWLSASRSPLGACPSIIARRPALWRRAREFDLVHVHGDVASIIALPLLRRQPAVVTTHGLSFLRRAHGLPLALARKRTSRVIHAARRVVCSSHAEREELLGLCDPTDVERLTVIPNAIALPARLGGDRSGALRRELAIAEDEVVGLYLGLLDRYKDPLTAVRAARIARERGARFTLLLAGDGPLLDAVRAQAGPAVLVLGFREDAERLLGAADVFVMPSMREGSSYALLEAMGHGLAIVASDGAGIPELLGDAGIVAPVGDADAFAEGLLAVASDPAYRRRLGEQARARVGERFGIERFTDSMRALYEAVLAGTEGR